MLILFFSGENGLKRQIHEVMIRDFTKIISAHCASMDLESLKDPYGKLVIVMAGYDNQTIKGLAELLYTGETNVQSVAVKEELLMNFSWPTQTECLSSNLLF